MTFKEKERINLDLSRKEELIDVLLVYMKNDLENSGNTVKSSIFNFALSRTEEYMGVKEEIVPEGNNLTLFKQIIEITDNEFEIVIKSCMTHEYIEKMYCGSDYNDIQITNKGFARANSVEKAKNYKPQKTSQITFNGPINASSLQIGNNNTQNIENTINNLINEIEKANITEKEKNEAKSLVGKFFNNPVISSILSTTANTLITKSLGGM
ncbi:MAG: hypothetical protein ACD_20C00357G0027 [uncultured bacterium]|nr:MAG: hypothetical protein ACD_20C00357G0027 [uncultured bacterium]HBH17898.1 hypothetical protein [Cyanobacteria bacterium UBA9579]